MTKKAKTQSQKHKKTPATINNFEPTKVALAVTCLGVSVVVLLAIIAVTTL